VKTSHIGWVLATNILRSYSRDLPEVRDIINPLVVAAAGLAHDLGHPVFGHNGEEAINKWLTERKLDALGRFEGNAQSFRIATSLGDRAERESGLGLTRATLAAMLKYPWTSAEAGEHGLTKFNAYDSEEEAFTQVVTPLGPDWRVVPPPERRPTVEAQLMDWADDLTYALHDAADYYRSRLIPLDELGLISASEAGRSERGSLPRIWNQYIDYIVKRLSEKPDWIGWELSEIECATTDGSIDEARFREAAEEGLRRIAGSVVLSGPYDGTRARRSQLTFTISNLMNVYVEGPIGDWNYSTLPVWVDLDTMRVEVPRLRRIEVQLLKGMLWAFVIRPEDDPGMRREQAKEAEVLPRFMDYLLEELARHFANPISTQDEVYASKRQADVVNVGQLYRLITNIPPGYSDEEAVARAVLDTVCLVTDEHVLTWEEQSRSRHGLSREWRLEYPV
jgi:dGTPase